jgi:microcystin-dependent protein
MSQPFVGQIILVGFNFVPVNWLPCDGRLIPIAEYDTLFTLIGTTFGGDGQTTFALPDLRGRVPMGMGTGPGLSTRSLGEQGGQEALTLATNQLPAHTHAIDASAVTAAVASRSGAANSATPVGNIPAGEAAGVTLPYSSQAADAAMAGTLIAGATAPTAATGGNGSHDNMQPYLVMQYIISPFGIFPSQ